MTTDTNALFTPEFQIHRLLSLRDRAKLDYGILRMFSVHFLLGRFNFFEKFGIRMGDKSEDYSSNLSIQMDDRDSVLEQELEDESGLD